MILLQDEAGNSETRRLSIWLSTRLGDYREWKPISTKRSTVLIKEDITEHDIKGNI